MNKRFPNAFFLLIAFACSVLLMTSQVRAQMAPAASPAPGPVKPAEQVFKNIQVMKGIPSDQIRPAMQFISASLGVECEFCHTRGAFDGDDKKPKQTARKMIEMQMAINKNSFDGKREVTCYSCHHGQHDPVAIPVISDEPPKRPEQPKPGEAAPALPTAGQVFDKYLQAVGGADALKKITTRSQTGSLSAGVGHSAAVQVLSKAPNKRATAVNQLEGVSITAYDGQEGWTGVPGGRRPKDMTRAETDAFSLDADFYFPIDVKTMFKQTRVRPSEKIGDHDAIQVIGIREGHPPLRLFFDKQSGLLLRMVRYAETPLGRNPTQIDYDDYREDSGVKVPFRWTIARPAGHFTIQIAAMQQNVPIEDSKFSKPVTMGRTTVR